MSNAISFPRLPAATVFAAVTGAFALALGLHFAAHGSSVQLPTVAQLFGMSAFFSLFTLPVSIAFALPAGWLWRRNGPIHPVKCALLGAVGGVLGGYGLLLFAFVPTPGWSSTLWFALAGSAAGFVMGHVMHGGGAETRSPRAAQLSQGKRAA